MQRRTLLKAVTGGAVLTISPASSQAARMKPTRRDAEGPYYPVEPIPLANHLLLTDEHKGNKLNFSGRVFSNNGTAVPACRVEIWQCDANSVYRHPRAPNPERVDRAFRGFGATVTDNTGKYTFTTIVPVPYPGRPPHIHVKVLVVGYTRLTSQAYLEGHRGHDELRMTLEESGDEFEAKFDIVLR